MGEAEGRRSVLADEPSTEPIATNTHTHLRGPLWLTNS